MSVLISVVLVLSLFNLAILGLIAAYLLRDIGIKKVLRPSTELADFLDDIKRHGYAVARIDPDSLLVRGVR